MNKLRIRGFRYAIMLILMAGGLYFLFSEAHHLSNNDFIEYWSGSRINYSGGNPYSPADLLQVQRQSGWTEQEPKLMVYPPLIFPLVIFFGIFNRSIAQLLWLLFQTGVILYCAHQLWALYGGPVKKQWLALIISFIFAPTIMVLELGQITPLILLGITGFLYFIQHRNNDWIAGAFLPLLLIKPQLLYLFWIALLFWVIKQRRWLVLVGAAVSLLTLILLAFVYNPEVIQEYLVMVRTNAISVWASPTIGMYLRLFWLGTDVFWPQFFPILFGGLWFLIYWSKHKSDWEWAKDIPILLLVTMITSPYTWTYDLVILLPVILQGTIRLVDAPKQWSTYLLFGMFLGISILDLVLHIRLSDFWFIWLAPAMLIWYLLVQKQSSAPRKLAPA